MIRRDNFTVPQGTDWGVRWVLTDPAGKPIDTSGWTVRSQIRRRHNSAEILHEWSSALGNATIVDSSVTLSIPHAISSGWSWSKGVYDVEVTDSNGVVTRLTQGTITVSPEVTR